MKKLIIIPLLLIFCSCTLMEAERKYNEQSWELKMKNDRLDYLERLYKVKHDIEYREQRRVIDSLINKVYEH